MIISILIIIFSFLFLMVLHEFGHFIIARKFGVKVEEFGVGYPPRLFGKKIGDIFYSVNLIPFGAFVKVEGETEDIESSSSFSNKPLYQKFLIVLGGVLSFWLVAFLIFSLISVLGQPTLVSDEENFQNAKIVILDVAKSSPGAISGLKQGDIILAIRTDGDFININKVSQLQSLVKEMAGKEIVLKIQRNKEILEKKVMVRENPPASEGPIGIVLGRLVFTKTPFYKAPIEGLKQTVSITWRMTNFLFSFLKNLILHQKVLKGVELMGPVGVGVMFNNALNVGFSYFLWLLGIISINFAIFNLLPIPALDGGKILFLVIEAIRKKPVRQDLEQKITIFCFALLITLMILVTFKDIKKLF